MPIFIVPRSGTFVQVNPYNPYKPLLLKEKVLQFSHQRYLKYAEIFLKILTIFIVSRSDASVQINPYNPYKPLFIKRKNSPFLSFILLEISSKKFF